MRCAGVILGVKAAPAWAGCCGWSMATRKSTVAQTPLSVSLLYLAEKDRSMIWHIRGETWENRARGLRGRGCDMQEFAKSVHRGTLKYTDSTAGVVWLKESSGCVANK
jgi:hypothetical protein